MNSLSLLDAWNGSEEKQEEHVPQQKRSIWGRLIIAEVPYPVIAADGVVISLYFNRLLFRVSSSAFTVTVFLRDIVRIVLFAEKNSIEMEVDREGGGQRAYIVVFRENDAALMLYDVVLPLLPVGVKDSSVGHPLSQPTYTADYSFSLMSPNMMAESGFYELYPRRDVTSNESYIKKKEEEATTRLHLLSELQSVPFPSGEPPFLTTTLTPQRKQAQEQNTGGMSQASEKSSFLPAILSVEVEETPPEPNALSQAASDAQKPPASSEGGVRSAEEENNLQDDPHLMKYIVVNEAHTHGEGDGMAADTALASAVSSTPLSWRIREVPDTFTSFPHDPQAMSSGNRSPSAARLNVTPGAFRIGSGVAALGSRSMSSYSYWSCKEGRSFASVPRPPQSSSLASSKGF
ncbi:hypothetical protein MOQ_000370 [Trypanosoma cruzi marinkellei]|uniref:Uncharacterized protein n=1 Tax=Trypanosoma cruzi marinkellei TaxID=85056 RepID=K2NNK4_TRYCR|nr:hypothetical protein MOQ_000370 [Trypanosoma cruzi marinkellei]